MNILIGIKNNNSALAGIAQWIERELQTEGLLVRFPIRAHAWVAGPGPQWGPHEKQPHVDISLSFSLPSPLSKNKYKKSLKKNNNSKFSDHFAKKAMC